MSKRSNRPHVGQACRQIDLAGPGRRNTRPLNYLSELGPRFRHLRMLVRPRRRKLDQPAQQVIGMGRIDQNHANPVVAANPGEARHRWLDQAPQIHAPPQPGVEDDDGGSGAGYFDRERR